MKKCPQCSREYDNSMMFCLDDGAELLYGPALSEPPTGVPGAASASVVAKSAGGQFGDEPATAILHETAPSGENRTRAQINTTNETAILPDVSSRSTAETASRKNSLIAGIVGILLCRLWRWELFLLGTRFDETDRIDRRDAVRER
jgi:hypothetical protein